ncbi:MAG: chemotaxis protein CheW [Pseudomonadota bacterium]
MEIDSAPLAGQAPAQRDFGPADAALAAPQGGQFLSFRLGAEEYGIDILKVQEIRSYEAPTRLAGAPPFVMGVVNLRGTIVPIIDLRLAFALADVPYDEFTVVIILNVAQRVVGAVVDSVSDVVELQAEDIRPAPAFNTAIDASHILGLGSLKNGDQERLLILTDIERLMGGAAMGLVDPARQSH